MRLERNASRLGAVMIMEGSWFQAIIVRGKSIYRRRTCDVDIGIYPRMGPPSGALRECQPGSPRFPYRRMSNYVHHSQACIGSTRGQRNPLQLAEHSGDAAGIVPAVADVPGRATLHHI